MFLAPLGGVIMSEYMLVHHRRIAVPDLFMQKRSVYWYTGGWNWRAVLAFVCGM